MNKENWTLLDTKSASAEENMRIDSELLERLDPNDSPILHFYDWEGESATYGHFVNPSDYLNLDEVKEKGLNLAKRPTGGGIVFHIWDLAFSVLIPANNRHYSENTLENYNFVNKIVLQSAGEFLSHRSDLHLIKEDQSALDSSCARFCMAQPTKYDVVLNGKKIAGAAQRKRKNGFLHQGTICLKMPDESYLKSILASNSKVLEATFANSFPLLKPEEDLKEGREKIKALLQKYFIGIPQYV